LFLALIAAGAGAAEAQVQILDPIEVGDRKVVIRWTPAAGDTFTPAERVEVTRFRYLVSKTLTVPRSFLNGQLVVGEGAGIVDRGVFAVRVGDAQGVYAASSPPAPPSPATFDLVSVFQFGRNLVAVAFSDRVDPGTALDPAHYDFEPDLPGMTFRLQDNGQTVIVESSATLPASTAYTLTVSGVTSQDGDPLVGGGPLGFQTVAPAVVNIADLQSNPGAFLGQSITVVAQVFVPVGLYTPANGYVQDGSGRGLHLGGTLLAAVNQRTNVAAVSGTFGTASGEPELTGYTASVVAAEVPPLGARTVPLDLAVSSRWRGTYIRTQGYLSRIDRETDPDDVIYEVVDRDTLFTGYQVWRAPSDDPTNYSLLRTYSLLDSTWTFVGNERVFADPDSIILRGTERDPDQEPGELLPGPFNGFGYLYSITTFDAVVDPTVFPFDFTVFDTLTAAEGAITPVIFPGKLPRVTRPLLSEVKVVPNPYNPSVRTGAQSFPGAPRVQFINLPSTATISIYTVAGDLVRELAKQNDTANDFVDWDLKNADGNDVASGIYVYFVEAAGEKASGRFVVAR
jgi:hypothetical protein